MMQAAALLVLAFVPLPVLAQEDHVLTCGLADCSQLGDPYYGLKPEVANRMQAVADRLGGMSETAFVELVALSIGQVGCYAGWPSEDMVLEPYYDAAIVKLVRNLQLAPDEAAFFENEIWEAFHLSMDELAAQGRLVSVTEYDDELIPAACATGP